MCNIKLGILSVPQFMAKSQPVDLSLTGIDPSCASPALLWNTSLGSGAGNLVYKWVNNGSCIHGISVSMGCENKGILGGHHRVATCICNILRHIAYMAGSSHFYTLLRSTNMFRTRVYNYNIHLSLHVIFEHEYGCCGSPGYKFNLHAKRNTALGLEVVGPGQGFPPAFLENHSLCMWKQRGCLTIKGGFKFPCLNKRVMSIYCWFKLHACWLKSNGALDVLTKIQLDT